MCFVTLFFFLLFPSFFYEVLLQIFPCFSIWTKIPTPREEGIFWGERPEYISLDKQNGIENVYWYKRDGALGSKSKAKNYHLINWSWETRPEIIINKAFDLQINDFEFRAAMPLIYWLSVRRGFAFQHFESKNAHYIKKNFSERHVCALLR